MVGNGGIVVGVNGAASGWAALDRAAGMASKRGVGLTLLHAWEIYPLYEGLLISELDLIRLAGAQVLTEASARLADIAPDLACDTSLVESRADAALIDASRHAGLLVVGRHSGNAAWLGPVLGHVAVHAHCPVMVVPPELSVQAGPVVVGVDGSSTSTAAVAYAFEEAAHGGSALTAVMAVPHRFDAYLPGEELLQQIRDAGERELAESLTGWSQKYPDVAITRQVSMDSPLVALRTASTGASQVVVGSHGRGALLRTALGSVSSSLLRSATCPVVVVRPEGT